jgi:large subunit ribosomal protein L3
MGGENVTVQNLTVVGVRPEENVLLVKGGIPGARGSLVVIRKATKA